MYNPFVRACNYALDKLSKVQVDRLPPCSNDRQIVFVRNHDRSVGSDSHQRESLVRPDIVLLQWENFRKLSGSSSYSESYEEEFCTSTLVSRMSWRQIRSTVEFKKGELLKQDEWPKTYEGDFGALKESPHAFPAEKTQSKYLEKDLPVGKREHAQLRMFLLLTCLYRWLPDLGKVGREGKLHIGNLRDIKHQAKARRSDLEQ